jgi:beta-glucanase (GH16 family)
MLAGALVSCEKDEAKSKKRFIITSSGDGFHGYYIVDGEDPISFSITSKDTSEYYYKYSCDLDANTSSLYYNIDGNSTSVDSIQILIYNGDNLVSNKTSTPDSYTNKTNLSNSYTFSSASASSSK